MQETASLKNPPEPAAPAPAARARLGLVPVALLDYGVMERPGASNAPEILAMAKDTGAAYMGDATAWCGLAMGAWVTRAGGTPPSGFLAARSWLSWGQPVDGEPQLGDVCVLWRTKPDAWEGHVGIFIARRDSLIYLLGGNQGNTVTITSHRAERLLGYRRG